MGNSKYETHIKPYFEDIFYWVSHGKQLKWIASELGVAESTFMLHKKNQSELSELIKKAGQSKPRYIANKAELALKDKLQDRETEETHTEMWKDEYGNVTKQHVKKSKKIIPADTTAIIFALKNTDPERWNDMQQIQLNGDLRTNPYANLTEEELRRLANGEDD